jgi:hypothetical protein
VPLNSKIVISVGVVLSAVAFGYYQHEAKANSDHVSYGTGKDDELRAQINALQQQVAQLEANQRLSGTEELSRPRVDETGSTSSERGKGQVQPPVEEPDPRQRLTVEQAQLDTTERFVRYDETFRKESRDASWAQQVERQASTVFSLPALKNVQLQSFDCGSSLCKLAAHANSASDFSQLARTLPEQMTSLPQGTFRKVDDGRGGFKVEAYFARAGQTLPKEPTN